MARGAKRLAATRSVFMAVVVERRQAAAAKAAKTRDLGSVDVLLHKYNFCLPYGIVTWMAKRGTGKVP